MWDRTPVTVVMSVSIWSKSLAPKTTLYVYDDKWFRINGSNSDRSLSLHWLAAQFHVSSNVPLALGPFTAGYVELKLPSLWRYDVTMDAWRGHRSFCWVFWTYFVIYIFDMKLFRHVEIRIDPGRSWVTSTTPHDWLLGGDTHRAALSRRPCTKKKSPGCCWHNSLPTVINPVSHCRCNGCWNINYHSLWR